MNGTQPDHLHQLRVELSRLGGVDVDHLMHPIPHIEDWTVGAVVGHTGWLARYGAAALASSPDNPPSRSAVPEPPAGPEVLEWFDEAQRELIDVVEQTDPQRMTPTFTGPQPASWWCRRLAHEASMHRWDAYAASGSPEPIDARLAQDGIDEVFEVFVPNRLNFEVLAGAGETMHLHATDIDDGEWMITYGPDAIEWHHGHDKGDVAARGPVADLLLMLWGRLPPSRLELYGDSRLLDRWQAAATF